MPSQRVRQGVIHQDDGSVQARFGQVKTPRLEASTVAGGRLDKSTVEVIAARPFVGATADRYKFLKSLGSGGFGDVFLARDEELQRLVAIKLWHRPTEGSGGLAVGCLEEARMVAKLDHPAVVPVYDMGTTRHGSMFIVSKYIEGEPLVMTLRNGPLPPQKAATIAARIARALDHAHEKGLVHRDVKPANILLDADGNPHLIDFGIAMREDLLELDTRVMGTPAYMSPEQARGEGHLVNRRSDVFSLGVVLYEMLTGTRAFPGDTISRVLASVESGEPPDPSAIDANVGRQLDRICTKAIAKRARDRFASCRELAEDLESFLKEKTAVITARAEVVPKGLRAFDADDSDFFLELLPGPRDRTGLPESLRLWKQRIEATDNDPFRVGMLYGPSGCGKSSFVRAGLLPQLGPGVLPICIEADAAATEGRLLRSIQSAIPDLDPRENLADVLGSLRRRGLGGRRKLLLVIDQFEQWLNANAISNDAPLIQALRQCDGTKIQCLALVRDDFWLTASRFMEAVEVDLNQNTNVGMVDLFDLEHAQLVLGKFGRAHGRLPQEANENTRAFLQEAAEDLAENGRIVPVRLAVFAEMMKSRDWTSGHLLKVGGARGLGRAFLDDALGEKAANPFLRQQQDSVKQLLKQLLPEVGTNIKGAMKSFDDLREQCAQPPPPDVFRRLIKSLDQELKLITPADVSSPEETVTPSTQYYQLTHDFLVPAIREWLTGELQATRRGRAQILLAERAQNWGSDPRNRLLPDLWEWGRILMHTDRKTRTTVEGRMVARANRFHVTRLAGLFLLALSALVVFREVTGRIEGKDLAGRIIGADLSRLPELMAELQGHRRLTVPYLRAEIESRDTETPEAIRARLAMLAIDGAHAETAIEQTLSVDPAKLGTMLKLLSDHAPDTVDRFKTVLTDDNAGYGRRLRAAAAVATLDPGHLTNRASFLPDIATWLAGLAGESAAQSDHWASCFQPIARPMSDHLVETFRRTEEERRLTSALLIRQLRPEAHDLAADLFKSVLPTQIATLQAVQSVPGSRFRNALLSRFDPEFPAGMNDDDARNAFASEQVNLALALFLLGQQESVWPWLKMSPDPRFRYYLIHRAAPARVDASVFINRLFVEPEPAIRQALLSIIGDYPSGSIPPSDEERMQKEVMRLVQEDDDAGVHSMAEWLCREWEIDPPPIPPQTSPRAGWFSNGEAMTFSIVRGPVEFTMGTDTQFGTMKTLERSRRVRIPRSFALSTKETTVEQFLRFRPDDEYVGQHTKAPAIKTSLFDAMLYCRWLSEREGVPESEMCYRPSADGKTIFPYPDFLNRTGYRLPTEAEWEYCCRAGSDTIRPYGSDAELLSYYAWTFLNSDGEMKPVSLLRPNRLGYFDMLGNASEWCQDKAGKRGTDDETELIVDYFLGYDTIRAGETFIRKGRPGPALSDIRSAARLPSMNVRSGTLGFRVARTIREKIQTSNKKGTK